MTAFSPALRAAMLMTVATAFTALQNVVIRVLSDGGIHPFEIAFFRCLFGFLAVAAVVLWRERAWPRIGALRLVAVSSLFHLGAMLGFFYGLSVMPLNDSAALTFAAPLYSTIGAALFLGEKVHARRWIAIVIGFAGVLVVLRPGMIPFTVGAAAVLFSSISFAGVNLLVKRMSGTERATTVVFYQNGFPELAYSWRKVMAPLAVAGFYVVAPDQRGYGRTLGWDPSYDGDLAAFRFFNLVRDALGLLATLGRRSVAAVVGHDFGSPVAAWCALLRPDIFRAVALMSAPFAGPPSLARARPAGSIHDDLAALKRPRKHYQWYYSTRAADTDMRACAQGIHAFLRAYYHVKSADWLANRPFPLAAWSADELAKLPTYYVMDRDQDMAATVAPHMPDAATIARCAWLTEDELRIYSDEFARTGFQGGLQWYRCRTTGRFDAELEIFADRRIEVPSCFIAGASDWGIHQTPGALERMQREACARMLGCHLVDGAGHWVQQERPETVASLLLEFLARANATA
jgi:pimeloyl-ACP methyl ester carboxylesterase